MAPHDLSNTKTTILGATAGVIPQIGTNPHDRFSCARAPLAHLFWPPCPCFLGIFLFPSKDFGVSLLGKVLGIFVFSAFFQLFRGSQGEKSLDAFEVFLGFFAQDQGKEGQGWYQAGFSEEFLSILGAFVQGEGGCPLVQCLYTT